MKFLREILTCPYCKNKNLRFESNTIKCDSCGNKYDIDDEISIMINTGEDIKKKNIEMYTNYNKYFKEAGMERYATFMNLGYVINDNKQYSNIELSPFMMNRNSVKLLLEVIGDTNLKGKKVLDVSCGRGGNISAINNYFEPSSIVGLDICYENIRSCKEVNKADNTHYCVGDAENMPFINECFDVVLNIESAFSYPNRFKFYDEVHRVLSVGGIFLYADILKNDDFDKSEKYLKEKGFKFIRNQDITANIIESCNQASISRMNSLINVSEINDVQKIKNMMVAPGSSVYDELKNKIQKYKIVTLVKEY